MHASVGMTKLFHRGGICNQVIDVLEKLSA